MILWHVEFENHTFHLDVDRCTLLVGQNPNWYDLVRKIDDFFNVRNSDVLIEEDTMLIQKKDWDCYFIPFDATVNFNKITSKSPLNYIVNQCIEHIKFSPIFQEIEEIWRDFQEEVYLVNESMSKYSIKASLKNFDETSLKNFIFLESMDRVMTPISDKVLLLRLIKGQAMKKQTLIILEFPELYASQDSILELQSEVDDMMKAGYNFIIVTSHNIFEGRKNYSYDSKIINEPIIELLKEEIIFGAPFAVKEKQFIHAKNFVLQVVDNSTKRVNYPIELYIDDVKIGVLAIMIFKKLNIKTSFDSTVFPPNILNFIEEY